MHAYVINLARSADRRTHMRAELKKTRLDYEIVTAVDGRDLDLGDTSIVHPTLVTMTNHLSGTAGGALSHLSVYRKILEDGLDNALVLEDDVTLPADLAGTADAVADHLNTAEVALLSYDTFDPCQLSIEGAVHLSSTRVLALPIDIFKPRSGGAYVITREACERMTKFVLPIRVNPDDWWFWYREGALDRVRCVVPMPVRKNPSLVSTMGSYRLNGTMARLAWPLVSRKIPLLHQALNYRRERIYRRFGHSELVDIPFIEKPSRLD